jgi:uncharacterized 2Fe-2S/4Fe-4S cluster protein (DUF4445 family)
VAEEATVVFLPSGRRGKVRIGSTILEAARSLGADIDSVCGGHGWCGRCQVSVTEGTFPKFGLVSSASSLGPLRQVECDCAADGGLASGRRLGCVARIGGDLVIDVPPESQVCRPLVRKSADQREVDADPLIRLHYIELPPASLEDQSADVTRVERQLAEQWGLPVPLGWSAAVLAALPGALRSGGWRTTVAVRRNCEAAAVWPGFRQRAIGLAVDVGTTTLAAHLCDLATGEVLASAGAMNPQITYGEDVMSRISHAGASAEARLQLAQMLRQAIERLAVAVAGEAQQSVGDILEVAIVGNPTMHHLLLGFDPAQLGASPFPLVVDRALDFHAAELGLTVLPLARIYVLPCIAGHVGADTAGMLLAEAPAEDDTETVLMVDVGTNAEIVLAHQGRLWACSSPTGPAFEGAQISAGQRAAPGAIERVRIDRGDLTPRLKAIGSELWSDAPGFEASHGEAGVTGICGSGIIEAVAELYLAGIVGPDGRINGDLAAACPNLVPQGLLWAYRLYAGNRQILVTQSDVRAIQLAKAALYAGAKLLMRRAGARRLDRIVLAGAFGSYIDPTHALVLGMIPDCSPANIRSAGNAAGTGARIALVSAKARRWIEDLVRRVDKVETAADPSFQTLYVEAMALPHARDDFPHVGLVAAPPIKRRSPCARPG